MLTTTRLTLIPLTADQLQLYIEDTSRLEQSLGLPPGQRVIDEFVKSILINYIIPRLANSSINPLYHTLWTGIDRERGVLVGEAKFKGEPDETGTVEIGYGTHPAFQGQGYMTEIVGALLDWAWRQTGVKRVVAETHEENVASQSVLRANGFRQVDRIDKMLWWEIVAEPIQRLTFDKQGYLTPYQIIPVTSREISFYFATNAHRINLWAQYTELLTTMNVCHIPVLRAWIGGSFCTTAPFPANIDSVIFVHNEFVNNYFADLAQLRDQFADLHITWVGLRDEDNDVDRAFNNDEKSKWMLLFSTDRMGTQRGFLELNL